MPPPLLNFLHSGGRAWAFTRLIVDRLTQTTSRAEGTSLWALSPASPLALAQSEEGELFLPAARAPLPVRAAYAWTWPAPDAHAAAIAFSDGRPFIAAVDFLESPCRVHHFCAPDTYDGFFLRTPDGFEVTYVVAGPSKDYTSTTRFVKPFPHP
jgi:hypothetical protein